MKRLDGKSALITGAARGIGKGFAAAYLREGATVAIGDINMDAAEATAAELGMGAYAVHIDVTAQASIDAAIGSVVGKAGKLDILINNAGALKPIAPLIEADPEEWGHVLDVNTKGVFNGMRAAMPVMLARGGGTVITISSGAAHRPLEGWSAYCTSKAGTAMLTRAAHLENADKGLRIMGLSPGTVATQMQRDIKASGVNPVSQLDWEDHVPPEWPAKTLMWMCTPAADGYLGEEISLREEEVRRTVGLIA